MGEEQTPASGTHNAEFSTASSRSESFDNTLPSILRPAVLVSNVGFATGDLIGRRFEVEELLGRGGMGDVFRVADTYNARATRALKTIRPRYSRDPAFADRFRTEVGIALCITHPNVCRVYDFGIDESADQPRLFYTMELLTGLSLAEHLKKNGALPRKSFHDFALRLVAGLEAAHKMGVIHRDLKPGNIMLPDDGGLQRPVILDFGLASFGVQEGTGQAASGTICYMAPEQMAGGTVTPVSDIYALGLILYESLTGERPGGISTLTQYLQIAASGAVNTRHIERSRVPRLWARIILRCIRQDPAERYRSVSEIRAAVEGWRKLPRRAVIGALAATAAGVTAFLWPRPLRGSYSRNPDADAAYQTGKLHSRRLTTDELRKAVSFFHRAVKLDPDFALAWSGLADAYSSLADYGGLPAQEAFDRSRQAALEARRKGPDIGAVHASLGLALSNDPRHWTEAGPSFERARQLDPSYGPLHQWYASHLARLGRTEDAIAEARLGVEHDPVSLPVNSVLGWMFYYGRQHRLAIQQARKMIDLDPSFLHGYIILARACTELALYSDASNACRDAALHGGVERDGTEAAVLSSTRGCLLARSGDADAALQVARKLDETSRHQPINISYVAAIYSLAGELDSAFDCLDRGVAANATAVLYVGVYPPFDPLRHHPRYAPLLRRLGLPQTSSEHS